MTFGRAKRMSGDDYCGVVNYQKLWRKLWNNLKFSPINKNRYLIMFSNYTNKRTTF